MESHQIYSALNEKGLSARMIAAVLGVTNQAVSDVIRMGRGSRRIAEAIAKIIDRELIEVFPYYDKNPDLRQEKVRGLRELLVGR